MRFALRVCFLIIAVFWLSSVTPRFEIDSCILFRFTSEVEMGLTLIATDCVQTRNRNLYMIVGVHRVVKTKAGV